MSLEGVQDLVFQVTGSVKQEVRPSQTQHQSLNESSSRKKSGKRLIVLLNVGPVNEVQCAGGSWTKRRECHCCGKLFFRSVSCKPTALPNLNQPLQTNPPASPRFCSPPHTTRSFLPAPRCPLFVVRGTPLGPHSRRWGCSHLRLLSLRTCSVREKLRS